MAVMPKKNFTLKYNLSPGGGSGAGGGNAICIS